MSTVSIMCNRINGVAPIASVAMAVVSLDMSELQASVALGELMKIVSHEVFGNWMELNCPDIVAEWRAEGAAALAQSVEPIDDYDDNECDACHGTGEGLGESACGHCRGKGFTA